jgi:Flp pilus assembly pilin Flp
LSTPARSPALRRARRLLAFRQTDKEDIEMGYRIMGALHARLLGLRDDSGQGTVEYVALILLIAAVMGAVVKAGGKDFGIAAKVGQALKDQIEALTATK